MFTSNLINLSAISYKGEHIQQGQATISVFLTVFSFFDVEFSSEIYETSVRCELLYAVFFYAYLILK